MSIFVDQNTKLLVQGITGREGQFHTRQCIAYGTQVVAGVTPGKGGQKMDEVPVFNTVREAVAETGANCSMIFVPPPFAADAVMEAVDGGVELRMQLSSLIEVHRWVLSWGGEATAIAPKELARMVQSSAEAMLRSPSERTRPVSPARRKKKAASHVSRRPMKGRKKTEA